MPKRDDNRDVGSTVLQYKDYAVGPFQYVARWVKLLAAINHVTGTICQNMKFSDCHNGNHFGNKTKKFFDCFFPKLWSYKDETVPLQVRMSYVQLRVNF